MIEDQIGLWCYFKASHFSGTWRGTYFLRWSPLDYDKCVHSVDATVTRVFVSVTPVNCQQKKINKSQTWLSTRSPKLTFTITIQSPPHGSDWNGQWTFSNLKPELNSLMTTARAEKWLMHWQLGEYLTHTCANTHFTRMWHKRGVGADILKPPMWTLTSPVD